MSARWAPKIRRGAGIAARAGTGKQTVYRWWPSKADVLHDALVLKADVQIGLDDHGGYAADLRQFLDRSFALALAPSTTHVMRTLMAQAQIDPVFGACFREQFLARRRAAF
ncbi:TetR/AcrR family transcriptional regulator C-terminal ligand-binding domain-containing protein [Streptomyces javensis]|uniref:TetR/AcrR family transcriptional regulator C-terminal ligand-binding domain-containing protein n=1 Tax=Streptomyces javensis TaxID=114698 RepID=UPI0033DE2045